MKQQTVQDRSEKLRSFQFQETSKQDNFLQLTKCSDHLTPVQPMKNGDQLRTGKRTFFQN